MTGQSHDLALGARFEEPPMGYLRA